MNFRIKILILIVCIGIGISAVILANQKSPKSSQNLLEYIVYHQKSWVCNEINGDDGFRFSWEKHYYVKDYYLGIPILKSSCQDGYVIGNEK